MTEKGYSWVSDEGIEIKAAEWRPEGAPSRVFVLVHGIGEHFGRYRHVGERLAKAGTAFLVFDLPGHGTSGGKRGCASFAAVHRLIDRQLEEAGRRFPGLPVFLYGHSLGGAVALSYLIERRPAIAGAVVTSPAIELGQKVPAAKVALAKLLAGILPSLTMPSGLDCSVLSSDPAVVKAYVEDPLVHPMVSTRLGLDLMSAGEGILAGKASITLPLFVAQGSKDGNVSPRGAERFAEGAGPNLAFHRYEGWFHELHNEPGKERFFQDLLSWLEGTKGA